MSGAQHLEHIRRAYAARDPELARLVVALAEGGDDDAPIREGALTWRRLRVELGSEAFRARPREDQGRLRVARWQALEAPDAEVALPARLRLHEILIELWADESSYARRQLLEIVAAVPLRWGPWRALKRIFKEAQARGDAEMFGALAARFDVDHARGRGGGEVDRRTLGYLVRRAWRHLRGMGRTLPACYADAVVEVLRFYPAHTRWGRTWLAKRALSPAFPVLWQRTPRPLFALLERALADRPRQFAADALKADFRDALREIEPAWVARLVVARSEVADDLVLWLLDNVSRFEQGALRALGLHDAALALLESPSEAAQAWAAAYARTHARDLPIDVVVRLANNTHEAVRATARALLRERDPRAEVGLDAWGRLFGTPHGHALAAKALRQHFGRAELTPAWFAERLRAADSDVLEAVIALLRRVHDDASLGAAFYCGLLGTADLDENVVDLALDALERFPGEAIDPEVLRRGLHDWRMADRIREWIDDGRVSPRALGADFLRSLAVGSDDDLAEMALALLGDARHFEPAEIGLEWALDLAGRGDEALHAFAVDFIPRSFAPAELSPGAAAAATPVDLAGRTFAISGKLAGMTRLEAEARITAAGARWVGSVTRALDYLVVGETRTAKIDKAEALIAEGAALRLVSERGFARLLAGEAWAFDAAAVHAGCEALWSLITAPGPADAPLALFARAYLRARHPALCLAETGRPVDPGGEIPADFLTFERARALLADAREPLRALGLDLLGVSLAAWAPPMSALVELCELPYPAIRGFIERALTADDAPENAAWRLPPDRLTADDAYRFCESTDAGARAIGMALIRLHPRLAVPAELFRLTESPDARVRAFAVRQLWAAYRARGTTPGWAPPPRAAADAGPGPVERPAEPPAAPESLVDALRRTLLAIPAGRPPQARRAERNRARRPLPARAAKRALLEVVRDLAVEDAAFAAHVSPLLREFLGSRGDGERAACLVALVRIRHAHPHLEGL